MWNWINVADATLERPTEQWEIQNKRQEFHDALLAVLENKELTTENIATIEENMQHVCIQKLLDRKRQQLIESWVNTDKRLNQQVLDAKSRIIANIKALGIDFSLSTSKVKWSHIIWDTRIIEVNHMMVEALKEQV